MALHNFLQIHLRFFYRQIFSYAQVTLITFVGWLLFITSTMVVPITPLACCKLFSSAITNVPHSSSGPNWLTIVRFKNHFSLCLSKINLQRYPCLKDLDFRIVIIVR